MLVEHLTPELVDLAPGVLQPGRLYISHKHRAAVHLCCCGCGEKVVTPLSSAEWRIDLKDGRVTLDPSVGNWSMACQSHYVIRDNRVIWAPGFSERQIRAVFERDQRDLQRLHRTDTAPPHAATPCAAPIAPEPARPVSTGWLAWLKDMWRRLTR